MSETLNNLIAELRINGRDDVANEIEALRMTSERAWIWQKRAETLGWPKEGHAAVYVARYKEALGIGAADQQGAAHE